jgi:hypothetical protein
VLFYVIQVRIDHASTVLHNMIREELENFPKLEIYFFHNLSKPSFSLYGA